MPGWLDPETGEPTGCVENDPFAGFGVPSEPSPEVDEVTQTVEVQPNAPVVESVTIQPEPATLEAVAADDLAPDPVVSILVAALAFASLLRRLWGLR